MIEAKGIPQHLLDMTIMEWQGLAQRVGQLKSDVLSGNTNEIKKAKNFLVCRCMSEDFSGRRKSIESKSLNFLL